MLTISFAPSLQRRKVILDLQNFGSSRHLHCKRVKLTLQGLQPLVNIQQYAIGIDASHDRGVGFQRGFCL